MKHLIIPFIIFIASSCLAATAMWDDYSDPNAGSFTIFRAMPDGTRVAMLENIDIAATSVEVTIPNECGTYYIVAVGNGIESGPSNTSTWCPDPTVPPAEQPPVRVLQFNLTGEITIN